MRTPPRRRVVDEIPDVRVCRLRLLDRFPAGGISQDMQYGSQVTQRVVGGVADDPALGSHLVGGQVGSVGQRAGAHRNLRDSMRNDVVHLAGDSGPLV